MSQFEQFDAFTGVMTSDRSPKCIFDLHPFLLQRSTKVSHRYPIDTNIQVAPPPLAGMAQQRCCFREDLLRPVRKTARNPALGIHHSCQALSLHIRLDKKTLLYNAYYMSELHRHNRRLSFATAFQQDRKDKKLPPRRWMIEAKHCSERTATTPLPSTAVSSYC